MAISLSKTALWWALSSAGFITTVWLKALVKLALSTVVIEKLCSAAGDVTTTGVTGADSLTNVWVSGTVTNSSTNWVWSSAKLVGAAFGCNGAGVTVWVKTGTSTSSSSSCVWSNGTVVVVGATVSNTWGTFISGYTKMALLSIGLLKVKLTVGSSAAWGKAVWAWTSCSTIST